MKARYILTTAALALLATGATQADFVLTGNEHLNITSPHTTGAMFDSSTADLLIGGSVENAYVNDDALLRVLDYPDGVSGESVEYLYAYDTCTVDVAGGHVYRQETYGSSSIGVSGGTVANLYAYDTSSVDVSDGTVMSAWAYGDSSVVVSHGALSTLWAYGSSNATVSGGSFSHSLRGYDSSIVEVSGGDITGLSAVNSADVSLSGGSVADLYAFDTSSVTFYGYDFNATAGLQIDGNVVLGTGLLTGKWADGTAWLIPISVHDPGATILVVPEPATVSLLALGGVAMLGRRRRPKRSPFVRRRCHA